MLKHSLSIPSPSGPGTTIDLTSGSSVVLVGANGSGKTRLGVHLEQLLGSSGLEVHRIAAHRALGLNPQVQP
jgi:energy-coupling factor transporter ATP-binding protein EcfA2